MKDNGGGGQPVWILVTTNIRRFSFSGFPWSSTIPFTKLLIDGTPIDVTEDILFGATTLIRNEGRALAGGQRWKVRVTSCVVNSDRRPTNNVTQNL
jgi:hypothetical protein